MADRTTGSSSAPACGALARDRRLGDVARGQAEVPVGRRPRLQDHPERAPEGFLRDLGEQPLRQRLVERLLGSGLVDAEPQHQIVAFDADRLRQAGLRARDAPARVEELVKALDLGFGRNRAPVPSDGAAPPPARRPRATRCAGPVEGADRSSAEGAGRRCNRGLRPDRFLDALQARQLGQPQHQHLENEAGVVGALRERARLDARARRPGAGCRRAPRARELPGARGPPRERRLSPRPRRAGACAGAPGTPSRRAADPRPTPSGARGWRSRRLGRPRRSPSRRPRGASGRRGPGSRCTALRSRRRPRVSRPGRAAKGRREGFRRPPRRARASLPASRESSPPSPRARAVLRSPTPSAPGTQIAGTGRRSWPGSCDSSVEARMNRA